MLIKKICFLLLIFTFITAVSPVMADTVICNENFSLEAGEYTWYEFDVGGVPSYIHIELTCDDDIDILIMKEVDAIKWANGEFASLFRYSNYSSLNIYHNFMQTGTWYAILDNTDSLITNIIGHIKITAVDEIPLTTAVPTTTTTQPSTINTIDTKIDDTSPGFGIELVFVLLIIFLKKKKQQ